MTSVGEEYPRQQARARELLEQYEAIGPAGAFGRMVIEQAIKEAEAAAMSGDVVRQVRAFAALQALK